MKRVLQTFWESLAGGSRRFPRTLRTANLTLLVIGGLSGLLTAVSAGHHVQFWPNAASGRSWFAFVDEGWLRVGWGQLQLGEGMTVPLFSWSQSSGSDWTSHVTWRPHASGDWHGMRLVDYSLPWLTLQLVSVPFITMAFYFVRKRKQA